MVHELIDLSHFSEPPTHFLVILAVILAFALMMVRRLKPCSYWVLAGAVLVGAYHFLEPFAPAEVLVNPVIVEDVLLTTGIILIAYGVFLSNRPDG